MLKCPVCNKELIHPKAIAGARIRTWCKKCNRHVWIGPTGSGLWEQDLDLWNRLLWKPERAATKAKQSPKVKIKQRKPRKD